MRNVYKNRTLVCLCLLAGLFSANSLRAGEREDFIRLAKIISEAGNVSIDIKVKAYKRKEEVKPYWETQAAIKINGLNKYTYVMGRTYINNPFCSLAIDEDRKIIACAPAEKKSADKIMNNEYFAMFDSLIQKKYQLQYVVNNQQEKVIEVKMKNNKLYKSIKVWFNPTNNYLLKVQYLYNLEAEPETPYEKIDILYEHFSLNETIDQEVFSEKKYINVLSKKKIVPVEKYKSYQFINKLAD